MESCLAGDARTVTPVLRQLHADGAVVTHVRGLLLDEERDYLLRAASGRFAPSTVFSSDGALALDAGRTSDSAFLGKGDDPVVDCIGERLAALAQQPASHLEPLQLARYRDAQEYRPHHDYLGRVGESERTTTVFAYLRGERCGAGDACGGATVFPRLVGADGAPLRVYPSEGDAVMWSNRTADGAVNPETLHGGERLLCAGAQKVGLNAWFRDRPWPAR